MSSDLLDLFRKNVIPSSQCISGEHRSLDARRGRSDNAAQTLIPNLEISRNKDISSTTEHNPRPPAQQNTSLWHMDDEGADVLFDASLDGTLIEEDFGDFEEVEAVDEAYPATHPSKCPSFSLMDQQTDGSMSSVKPARIEISDLLNSNEQDLSARAEVAITTRDSTSSTIHNDLSCIGKQQAQLVLVDSDDGLECFLGAEQPSASKTRPILVPVAGTEAKQDEDTQEDWGSFEDGVTAPVGRAVRAAADLPVQTPISEHNKPIVKTGIHPEKSHSPTTEDARPSNIPPPAILLRVAHEVFEALWDEMEPSALGSANQKQGTCASPDAIVQALTVASRIVAGRALRWKRDNFLAQNTRIGPAGPGKGGGMKLAAVDKGEVLKEDREAADLVDEWQKHAHFLCSAIGKQWVRWSPTALCFDLRPRAAAGAGIVSASHSCALCGLKRDERLPQIDLHVEDSFGEFWVEHWGHMDCKAFWTQHKTMLGHR